MAIVTGCYTASETGPYLDQIVTGNYELTLTVIRCDTVKVEFSGNKDLPVKAVLQVTADQFSIVRVNQDSNQVWKVFPGPEMGSWRIRLLKKGNFYRFWINDSTGWIRSPLGTWTDPPYYEPMTNHVKVRISSGGSITEAKLTTLPWLIESEQVLPWGADGSFYEQQAIPGGIIKYDEFYYLYFMAGMKGEEEGASRRTIGVATSRDLRNWKIHPEPLITLEDVNLTGADNIYPNGAVITTEGKIALMYSTQKWPDWQGFSLAIAENPMGPFHHHRNNPVYKHFSHAHEFDLLRVDQPKYRYVLFYAGYTPEPIRGPAGDRGYVLFSDDLIHWKEHEQNPVFHPETLDNWDAVHIRPRSLNKIGNMWYLWYEGCNQWRPPKVGQGRWWDTVGLARSKDLFNWEYYPRNPALPALGINKDQFDHSWVGWPRMVVKDDTGYVYYTAAGPRVSVGLRTIAVKDLIHWETEGGETFILLK